MSKYLSAYECLDIGAQVGCGRAPRPESRRFWGPRAEDEVHERASPVHRQPPSRSSVVAPVGRSAWLRSKRVRTQCARIRLRGGRGAGGASARRRRAACRSPEPAERHRITRGEAASPGLELSRASCTPSAGAACWRGGKPASEGAAGRELRRQRPAAAAHAAWPAPAAQTGQVSRAATGLVPALGFVWCDVLINLFIDLTALILKRLFFEHLAFPRVLEKFLKQMDHGAEILHSLSLFRFSDSRESALVTRVTTVRKMGLGVRRPVGAWRAAESGRETQPSTVGT